MANARHDEWVRLYTEELLSCGRIAERHGVTERAVAQVLMKRGIPRRRPDPNKLGEELQRFYPEWVERYRNGENLDQIAANYGVGKMTVARALERMGVGRRQSREYNRKYRVGNAGAFDVIDSDEKAYFLGLLMADGNVRVGFAGEKSATVRLSLQKEDRCLVEALQHFLDTDAPIRDVKFTGRQGMADSEQVALTVTGWELAEALIRCGCVPRKTLIKEYPLAGVVPEHLEGAFLRGYFDGNGSLSGRANRNGFAVTFSTGSQAFALGLVKAATKRGAALRARALKSAKAFVVATESRPFAEKLYHWMYDAATVWLDRKRQRFEELLGTHA